MALKCAVDVKKDIINKVNKAAVVSRAFSELKGEPFMLQVNNAKQANIVANQINRDYKEELVRPSYSDPDNFYTIDPSDGLVDRYLQSHSEYLQTSTEQNSPKFSPETLKKVNLFIERAGIDVKKLDKIVDNTGQTIKADGRANLLKGLIEVVKGREDKALPEEAMHFAVDITEQKNPKLFNDMLSKVGEFQLYKDMININDNSENSYRNLYQTPDGKPDIRKIKKEAMGKLLAQAVNDEVEKSYPAEKAGIIQQWWNNIKNFLSTLFSKASNIDPFNTLAKQIVKGKNIGKASDIKGAQIFYSTNDAIIKANMKLVGVLNLPKARDIFSRFYQKGQKDIFFNKLTTDLQAPKNQVEILKQWVETHHPSSVDDMITGIASEMSYVVEINTAKQKGYREGDKFRNQPNFEFNGSKYEVRPMNDPSEVDSRGFEYPNIDFYYKDDTEITEDEYEKALDELAASRNANTSHYSNLTVPGGTNYTENEISTPAIVPSIKGHAQFATDNGIGWFRADEKQSNNDTEEQREEEEYQVANNPNHVKGSVRFEGGEGSKTRRILEVQSDLFQKGRNIKSPDEIIEQFKKEGKLRIEC